MKGLWTKDIRLFSSQQKNLAVIWLVAAGILIATDQISFAISYTSVITIMTAISTISYDTFDNGNAFLFTLPFSRKEYTREKYLFSLFWGMITVIGGILLVGIVTAAKGTLLMRSEEIVMAVLLNIPMLLIFQSMALPFLLKYEAEKGRIALAAMIGGIVFVVIFFFKMFETAGIELIDIVMNQMYLKNITLWASIYIISIVIWFLSLKIAEGIMLKKEF